MHSHLNNLLPFYYIILEFQKLKEKSFIIYIYIYDYSKVRIDLKFKLHKLSDFCFK